MRPRRSPLTCLLVCTAWLLAHGTTAQAHLPPAVYLEVEIVDTHVDVEIVLGVEAFKAWIGLDPGIVAVADPEHAAAILRGLGALHEVRVDGRVHTPDLHTVETSSFEDHEKQWSFVELRLRHATTSPARRVALQWDRYTGVPGHTITEVDCEWVADGSFLYPVFRPLEPAFIWHRPAPRPKPEPLTLPAPHPSTPSPTPWGRLLASLVGAAALATLWSQRRRLSISGRVLACCTAAALVGTALLLVPALGPDESPSPPSESEALAVFERLHAGVYTAVQAETESAIYDRLAAFATRSLVPTLYLDIHQSMILHKEGGVVAKVHRTEILDARVVPQDGQPTQWFVVEARWRVHGRIGHFGHTHQRTNEVLARVTIVTEDATWRMAGIDVLSETRAEDDG